MCEFKVGDVVRRIIADNNPAAKIGQVAVVERVRYGFGMPIIYVTYDAVKEEMWCADRAELVERKQEKPAPYQFKVAHTFAVGDKGKCRDGRAYEVVGTFGPNDIYTTKQLAVVVGGTLSRRETDGRHWWGQTEESYADLMPPTKTVWRVELTGVKNPGSSGLLDMTAARYYDTEENARKGIARGVNNYVTVKGPFPEEREA